MQVDPTQTVEKETGKFVIACAIDPLTKKPYPLVVNPITGELVTSGSGGSGDLSKKTDQYWVSDLFGSDTTGDGGVNKPFKTIQKAVDVIATIVPARNFEVIICISIYSGGPTVEIPVGLDISLINFTGSPFSVPLWIDLRLNGFTLTRVTGITLNTITELDSDSKILLIKEGDVGHVQPATPTALYVISEDAYIPDAAGFISQVASFDGTYRTGGSGGITLATVGQPLTDNELTTKKYVDDKTKRNVGKYWVSGEFGDNVNGNGGINNPYETIQKALTEGFALYDYIEVIFDSTTVAETCTVPSAKQLSLVGSGFTMGSVSIANKFHVELDDDAWLFTSNVRFSEIEFIGTGSPANVVINNCTVDALTNDSNIIFYPHSTIFLVTPTIVDFGTWFDNANMHFANRNLKDVLDPVDGQDAATKQYAEDNFSTITHDHADVIHDNVAGEISGITNKGTPVIGDVLLIEDSEDSGNKKSILIGALPSQPDSTAVHKTTAAEINGMVSKATPIDADIILGEDSATVPTAFMKIKITIANLKSILKTYFDTLYIAKATSSFPMSIGGTTAYARNQTGYMAYHGFYAAEINAQQCVPAGKVVHACLRVSTNNVSNATVVTVFKNGVATTMTFTIPAATTGYFSTNANQVTVASGDFISFEVAIGTGSGTQSISFKGGETWIEVKA